MIDGSRTPSRHIVVGGLIGLLTLILPMYVVFPPHLTKYEENININKQSYKTLLYDNDD